MDNKHKHLELIQGVVNRLSTNSFLLKGWSVVLVSALFALSAPDSRIAFVYLAYIPAIIFWGLDGFFLWQERLFRKLYDRVRVLPEDEVDFSMDVSVINEDDRPTWGTSILSKTLIPFHGVLILSVVIVMVLTLTAQE
ncbi:MAG: hypothetical protein L3K26_00115 [Candidatus Hydrogenedentes bacterium]|nr:hypothetical protein [Candidatus Hydrogenedentota bacterium]